MSSRPPLRTVPVVVTCAGCATTFRATLDWTAGAPASQRQRCPGCGEDVILDQDGALPPAV